MKRRIKTIDDIPQAEIKRTERLKKSKIIGGIVTYNPDITRLEENVNALINQVEQVYIFDNGSENIVELRDFISKYNNIAMIQNNHNSGMSVALNSLASLAKCNGATDIIYLDQDSVAEDSMVKKLAQYRSMSVGIVSPLVVDRNNERVNENKELIYEVKRPVTSGSLVNLTAWSTVGGYDEHLFVDWVDDEFADNLRLHGYKLIKIHSTSLLHELGNQEYAWSGPGRDYAHNRKVKRKYYRQNYPAWRWRDRARSQIITIHKYRFTGIGLEEIGIFIKSTIGRILLLENNKIQLIKAVFDGIVEARSIIDIKKKSSQ